MDTSKDLDKKVDKEQGKKLTSNDFTNQYKAKLDSVQENAQVNVIEEIRVNNVPLTITGKAVNISLDLSNYVTQSELTNELSGKEDVANKINSLTSAATHIQYASAKATFDFVNEKLSNVYKSKGSKTVAELNALVVDASMNGFVYNVTNDGTLTNGNVAVNAGDNVLIVWNEQTHTFSWDKLSGAFTVDLSNYYTKVETDNLLDAKANSADVYSKTDSDARYGLLGDSDDVGGTGNDWYSEQYFQAYVGFESNVDFDEAISFYDDVYMHEPIIIANQTHVFEKRGNNDATVVWALPYQQEEVPPQGAYYVLVDREYVNNKLGLFGGEVQEDENYAVGDVEIKNGTYWICTNDTYGWNANDWRSLGPLTGIIADFNKRINDATEVIVTTQEHLSDYENENGLNKIIRIRDTQGNVKDTYVIDKNVVPAVHYSCESTQDTDGNSYDGQPADFIRDWGETDFYNIFGENAADDGLYCVASLYYNENGAETFGALFGNGEDEYGWFALINAIPNREITIVVGKYFEYDGQGNKVFDENDSKIYSEFFKNGDPGGEYREITQERQEFTLVTDSTGRIYFDSDNEDAGGRFILYEIRYDQAEQFTYQAQEIGTSSGGGGTSEQKPIDINILEIKIIQDNNNFNPNAPDRCYYDYIQAGSARNDPRFAYLHIKSSFIDSYAEEQIEAGNFIIRFDYPTQYKKTSYKLKGDGRYSFLPNFYDRNIGDNETMIGKMPALENSFIYIDTNDIKTDAQGRKFIYKKIPITDLVNALWFAELTEEVEGGHTITTHPLFSNEFFEYDQGDLEGVRVGGAVQTHSDTFGAGFDGVSRRRDSGTNKYFATFFSAINPGPWPHIQKPFNSPNKDIPLLHYWCPFLLPTETEIRTLFARSAFSRTIWGPYDTHRKFQEEAVTKPRFAVLDPNYTTITQGSIWIKKYPQYNKRLYCYPGQMFPELFSVDGENQDVWIFRFGISK